ncbi:MAG TPA: TIGR03619 family F420-dependent LLM class oxidoreductase [Methylomirabilota bacterium]|nr:TIGR03619 family F420-dependent LLM class oxidoreductase [Methylomirabilota bacterium]
MGVQLPHRAELLGPVAARAEGLGYDSVWIGDHVAFHNPTLESLTALTWVAAHTTRVRLGPCVYLLALRHPTVVAKAVATLDVLSGGRVVFGVGVGGEFPKEFEAAGVPPAERGRRVDEGIAVCRAVWSRSPASFHGRFVRFADVAVEPRPVQPDGPPIWIGGRSDAALRRAARLGDGWVSYLYTPERYRTALRKIRAMAAEAGRDLGAGRGFEAAHLAFTVVDDDWERARATAAGSLDRQYRQSFDALAAKYCVLGPPDRCAATLARFVEAGARTLILAFVAGVDRTPEQLERFAAEVLPRLG